MCVFTGPIGHVAKTKIFARHEDDGREVLAYAMRLTTRSDVAMVLPLPVPPTSPDHAVTFLSLEGQDDFFTQLDAAFPARSHSFSPAGLGPPQGLLSLPVHQVGAFEASFVPTPADFARLDPRFRLSPKILAALPGYEDWGFAVFQLRGDPGAVDVHPMALSFPRRDPRSLFFPTVHVHDGTVPPKAGFDHTFYAQPDDTMARLLGWERSEGPAGASVPRAAGIVVDLDRPLFRSGMGGPHANRDVTLETPVLGDPGALDLRGPHHHLPLRVALPFDPGWRASARWRVIVREGLEPFAAKLGASLDALFEANRARWSLVGLDPALSLRHAHTPAGKPSPRGPCRMRFSAQGGDVELQTLELAFADVPPQDVLTEIQRGFVDAMKVASQS